jgi:hypothetical protein
LCEKTIFIFIFLAHSLGYEYKKPLRNLEDVNVLTSGYSGRLNPEKNQTPSRSSQQLPVGGRLSAAYSAPFQPKNEIESYQSPQKHSNQPIEESFATQPQIIYMSDGIVITKENLLYIPPSAELPPTPSEFITPDPERDQFNSRFSHQLSTGHRLLGGPQLQRLSLMLFPQTKQFIPSQFNYERDYASDENSLENRQYLPPVSTNNEHPGFSAGFGFSPQRDQVPPRQSLHLTNGTNLDKREITNRG